MDDSSEEPQVGGNDKHSRRVIFAFQAAALLVLAMGLFWSTLSLYKGHHGIAVAEVIMAAAGLVTWLMVRRGRIEAALLLIQVVFLCFITAFCLMFDTPNADGPRVTHIYLLPLAGLGYISYLRTRSKIQVALLAGCMIAFVAFSSTLYALPFADPVPAEMRMVGTWANSIIAVAMFCFCIHVLQKEFSGQKGTVRDLENAIRNDELELFYQPQVDHDGRVIGAEALLRWRHPQRGYLAPAMFIPLAEETGLMPEIGTWVLRQSCNVLKQWSRDPALAKLTLAVNVSAKQFMAEDFEQLVLEIAASRGIDPRKLKLEMTETVMIEGIDGVVAKMNILRAEGFLFSLDDFGTGYSSLSYLRQLPLDQIKIDRSFVQEGLETVQGQSLARSIIHMGLDMGLIVLAEGIETREQYELLLQCGCQEFQGYHFGRPVPRDVFEDFTRAAASQERVARGAVIQASARVGGARRSA